MNEHDGLDPTVAMPRIDVSQTTGSAPYPPPQPIPPQPIPPQFTPGSPVPSAARPAYRFGNPISYTLRRFLAWFVDMTVVASVATMLLYGMIAINPFTGLPNNSEGGFDATVAMGLGIAVLYIWIFESLLGTTLGKLAFALQVYAPRHRMVGFWRAFIRNLLRPVDFIIIGWILALLPGHRRLGDLLGGTVVAHSPLRSFSPLLGWLLLVGLGVVPFFVAGGTVTILAVAAAFVQFVPPLIARGAHTVLAVLTALNVAGLHAAPDAAPVPAPAPAITG
jgi:uncharacterized RDD family membrane protein YckC